VQARFCDKDLGLSIYESDSKCTVSVNSHTVVCEEDIADSCSLGKWLVGHSSLDSSINISESDQEVSSREGIEVVVNVSLNVLLIPNFVSFSSINKSFDEIILRAFGVHVSPERFSVSWVTSTSIVLFTAIVDNGDTSGCDGEDESIFEPLSVAVTIEEPGVVMIVNKDTESINIFEFRCFLGISISDVVHALAILPDVSDGEVHGVVEQSWDVVLVVTYIAGVTVEALANCIDSSSLGVL
jgi:hypothetical protein